MCTDKRTLRSGLVVSCGHCDQCNLTRKNDWVGRLIAEKRFTLGAVHCVTLTYGGDTDGRGLPYYDQAVLKNPHAVNFFYEHVQRWIQRLKENSDGVRYFVVGECGSEKGRVHWHALLFWQGRPVPNIVMNKRFMHWAVTPEQERALYAKGHGRKGIPLWPHGVSWWDDVGTAGPRAIEYVCKYLTKEPENLIGVISDEENHFGLSRMPPMGSEFFIDLARRTADACLPIRDWTYAFPDVTLPDGSRRKFLLPRGSKSRDIYLGAYVQHWREKHGNDLWPHSPPVDMYVDRMNGHYSRDFDALERDDAFRLGQLDRAGRFHPLLHTETNGRRWQLNDIGNDMFDAEGWPLRSNWKPAEHY